MRDLRGALAGTSAGELGLLFGSYTSRGPCIERFQPILLPSGNDQESLSKALVPFLDDAGDMPSAVGFFRVQFGPAYQAGRKALQITGADCDLVRRYLPRLLVDRALFLVIQTAVNRPWSAALFTMDADWQPGQRTPALLFPFEEYVSKGFENDSAPRTDKEPRQIVPAVRRDEHSASPNVAWILLAVLLTALIGGIAAYKWMRPANGNGPAQTDGSRSSSLALKVSRAGEDFEVSWNRSSLAVRQASRGALTIRDGGTTRTMQLDGPQLREGKILYLPLFTELSFRLEVEASNQTMEAESVQVLAWDAASALRSAVSVPDQPAQRGVPSLTKASEVPTPAAPLGREPLKAAPSAMDPRANSVSPLAKNLEPRPPLSAPVARPEPEPQKSVPQPASRPADPKSVAGNRAQGSPPVVPTSSPEEPRGAPTQVPAQAIVQTPSQVVEPVVPTASNREPRVPATVAVPRNDPPKAPEVQAAVQPPIPAPAPEPAATKQIKVASLQAANLIKRVTPAYPPMAKSEHIQGMVRFGATIGKDGTVQNLRLISGNPALVKAATDAVKQWIYRPTILNGDPVEVITQIEINFTLSQ